MINGINDVIAVGSVAVQRGQPCMGRSSRLASIDVQLRTLSIDRMYSYVRLSIIVYTTYV